MSLVQEAVRGPDALPPATLEKMVRDSIRDNLDLTKFREQQEQETAESSTLDELCERVRGLIDDKLRWSKK